jgi:hypothetical protein
MILSSKDLNSVIKLFALLLETARQRDTSANHRVLQISGA